MEYTCTACWSKEEANFWYVFIVDTFGNVIYLIHIKSIYNTDANLGSEGLENLLKFTKLIVGGFGIHSGLIPKTYVCSLEKN